MGLFDRFTKSFDVKVQEAINDVGATTPGVSGLHADVRGKVITLKGKAESREAANLAMQKIDQAVKADNIVNAIEVAKTAEYQQDGLLAHMTFRTGDDGADLFRRACRSCHTINGYKPLAPAFDGTDEEFIAAIVQGAHALRGNMPPFLGTEEEASLIAMI